MKKPINHHRGHLEKNGKTLILVAAGLAVAGAVISWAVIDGPWVMASTLTSLEKSYDRALARLSPMMRLDRVDWEQSAATNLSDRAPVSLLQDVSGLKQGQELLSIDLVDLEKRLMAVPWLEAVHIQKFLPSKISVRYSVYEARALGVRKGKMWLISNTAKWIAPVDANTSQALLDLPVLVNEDSVASGLAWLDALEKSTPPELISVHEIAVANPPTQTPNVVSKMTAVVELKYHGEPRKLKLVALDQPQSETLSRLKKVAEYLVKNEIDASSIDIRPGKKVVVNRRTAERR